MNRYLLSAILISILFIQTGFTQNIVDEIFKNKTEIYFSFTISDRWELNSLTKIISIDDVKDKTVYAYANKEEFKEFFRLNYDYKILPHPGTLINPEMSDNIDDITDWDSYPTYDAYVNMMNMFAINYPGICKIVDAGNTIQGRKILFAVISDNVMVHEAEPQFMFSSSMHGDETTGYVLMLRLIDSLLSTYATNPRIANLINNVEIWINPLGNPDGTYRTGNSTVNGATRYNANNIDVNRNFPDPADGPHPDGNAWQPETIAMMNLAYNNNFVLSGNFHGGTEVVNYPWDTWSRFHPDDNWLQLISHHYADTCQANAPANYMNGYNDGITNGYAWYRITGGRQDFFTYFANGREITFEISDTKLLSPSLLPAHWNYNRKSFLTYMENVLYGIRGVVTDTSGNPLKAKITILNHDTDSSFIYSDSVYGNYYRMIYAGTYNIKISAPGYYDQIINNVIVQNLHATALNVELVPTTIVPVELVSFTGVQKNSSVILNWITSSEKNNNGFEVQKKTLSEGNQPVWKSIGFVKGSGTTVQQNEYSFVDNEVESGKYIYRLKQIDFDGNYELSNEIKLDVEIIGEFSLSQNYPNPFNPSTVITYHIPKESHVSLKIYNALGVEVENLVDQLQPQGLHKITLSTDSHFASGIYFYCLVVNGNSLTRKMILLK